MYLVIILLDNLKSVRRQKLKEYQRQLEDVERQLSQLEQRGVELEQQIRSQEEGK